MPFDIQHVPRCQLKSRTKNGDDIRIMIKKSRDWHMHTHTHTHTTGGYSQERSHNFFPTLEVIEWVWQ